jgi:hypothetical protein
MGERSAAKKGWLCTMLMQGQELDERMQPILWTKRPTREFVGAGSLWPTSTYPTRLNYVLFPDSRIDPWDRSTIF